MKTISLKLPPELEARLAQWSQARGVGRSEVVRAALEAYFAGQADGAGPSCADLAAGLIGCVAGPADLASTPRHLAGYGR